MCESEAMRFPVALACFLGVLGGLRAQGNLPGNLPRHGVIGLVAGPADPTRPAGPANPVTVERVIEGGAGDAVGFQTGDEIVSVDGQPVERVDQFVRAIGRHLAGQAVAVAVRHGGPPEVRTAVLKPRPFETSPGAEVLYQSVTGRGLGRRTIVTRPHREGRLPAVLLVGGLRCYSLVASAASASGSLETALSKVTRRSATAHARSLSRRITSDRVLTFVGNSRLAPVKRRSLPGWPRYRVGGWIRGIASRRPRRYARKPARSVVTAGYRGCNSLRRIRQ